MQTELSYFPGCSLHGSSKLYHTTIQEVLGRYGVSLKEIEDWSCCGATSAHKTDHRLAVALGARNMGIAQKEHRPVIAPCSSCYSRLVSTNVAYENDPALAASINGELENPYTEILPVRSILEVIIEGMDDKEAPQIVNPLKGLKVVSYYGCLLTRIPGFSPPDDVENPTLMDKIMKRIGAEPLDWSYKTECCGASSTVSDRGVAINFIREILNGAIEADAAAIVSSCPMCQLNLDMYQDEAKAERRIPVYFITELVGVALGLKSLMEREIKRHFVDGVSPLRNIGLL